jgi:hypothetical protein
MSKIIQLVNLKTHNKHLYYIRRVDEVKNLKKRDGIPLDVAFSHLFQFQILSGLKDKQNNWRA